MPDMEGLTAAGLPRELLLNRPDKLTVLMAVSRLAGVKLVIPAGLFITSQQKAPTS